MAIIKEASNYLLGLYKKEIMVGLARKFKLG